MKRRGFAPWEIVAVLSGILVAAVVLYPVLNRPREIGGPRTCQSGLKQIGLAFRMYTQDAADKYPPISISDTASANSAYGWADALQPYIKSTQIYQCPSEPSSRGPLPDPKRKGYVDTTQRGYTDYWYNRNLAGRKEEEVKNVHQIIVSGDGNDGHDNTNARYSISDLAVAWRTDKSSPAYRHESGAHYAFADGHVKWYKPEEISAAAIKEGKPTFALK